MSPKQLIVVARGKFSLQKSRLLDQLLSLYGKFDDLKRQRLRSKGSNCRKLSWLVTVGSDYIP